ncbi:protein translocase subunit SecF [filamentous cyanobacterium LEGE 11480]|uniref:Protein-export membrane protein SecF n=1 Tax=Romeriopsis navalis LEGE 11480 TaxID=2777977 RepID=A0A928VHV2_9CYAN|nr:protein translocase subunit SecF [Romeriopsis navalis]MBE9028881.1 protein translocase subunit SecF [Romeriopsis navalis LEGE 11480]
MKLNIVKQRKLWWGISLIGLLAGIAAMAVSWSQIGSPLRPSLDFVGGTRIQLAFDCDQTDCDKPVDLDAVRQILVSQDLSGSSVQKIEQQKRDNPADSTPPGLVIRTKDLGADQSFKLQAALTEKLGAFKVDQIDTVGPTLGKQLFRTGLIAFLTACVGIMAYLALRFDRDYAVFAIVAMLHDILLTMGVFAILGLVLQVEVDSLFIVALLTIVGFSVNDTVVIYDRVRETIKLNPGSHINDIVDDAVNQTLTRSINTTLTTLLSLVAIFLFGGETLKFFSLALIIGFLAGAYSSIFVASSLLALWREKTGNAIAPAAPVVATENP